ncbi:MAG TPA: hypothetical protein VFA43_25820 [Gemmatimonadaceae bacterium]|nr:hypothetical protein [Gemmatimonadaceae bacterium]
MMTALVLATGGLPPLGAQQSVNDSVQAATLAQLEGVIASYEPAKAIRWYRANDAFDLDGYYDKGLKWSNRLEIHITVTRQQTIWIRVYPQYYEHHINLDHVNNANGLMQQMLKMSYHNFFFWGLDDNRTAFAGYQFTLESGFPEAAVKEVIKSIPLIDGSVGDLTPFIYP